MYEPKPLATGQVELPPELHGIVDRLARHQHDVWARDRMREGWTFGAERDEARKRHPRLIAYEDLPERERERLRGSALEAIRALVSLGFAVTPSESTLESAAGGALAGAPFLADLPGARKHAEELLGVGEPLRAYETIEAALARWPDDLRLRQLRGLSLARSGAAERANETMMRLRDAGHGDGETLGILARTHKDLAARASGAKERADHLEQAFLVYRQGYDAALRNGATEDAYFTGINAATLSLLLGEGERAAALAREVRGLCLGELEDRSKDASYWLHATLAEAALLLGERKEAQEHYGRAAERAGARYADLSTTRRQARLLLAQREEDAAWVEDLLRVPPIVMFTGHMIDGPARTTPRFPKEREADVRRAIRDRLAGLRPAAGYASAACGGDILFLEALLEEERELHVVLPFPPAEFQRASVDLVPGSDWPQRFHRVLEAAASVTTASDHASEDPSTFVYANLILSGMAALHARRLETELRGLAVWDGKPAVGAGGTASLVDHWRSRGVALEHIGPDVLLGGEGASKPRAEPTAPPPAAEDAAGGARDELMAMLFADAVGYSQLSEDQTRLFVAHFLSPIAELIDASSKPPVLRETAGDGFYFVFEHARDAGLFAVSLQDLVARLDWEARGLPATLGLRVALHCGPVQKLIDPITRSTKYTGPHTSRTARIEPITPPGQVYASQAFAAVAAAAGVEELGFEYVGRTALAKKYGSLPLYHVRRA